MLREWSLFLAPIVGNSLILIAFKIQQYTHIRTDRDRKLKDGCRQKAEQGEGLRHPTERDRREADTTQPQRPHTR